ncbi:MAG: alpha/beta hydrolase [Acidobacteriota bacterium]
MSLRLLCIVLCLFGVQPAVAGETTLPTVDPSFDVAVTTGLVYGVGEVQAPIPGLKDLLLDLYEPTAAGAHGELLPALVIIHGGGFFGGSRQQEHLVQIANEMATRGYVVVSIDYRLVPDEPVPSPRVEPILQAMIDGQGGTPTANGVAAVAAIDDGLTALDWLREAAGSLGVDPARIGILGGSAGAITSVHMAYVLDNYGVPAPALSFVVDLWGGSLIPPDDPAAAAAHLEAGEPPLFVIHGIEDRSVPVELSELLVARALEQGVVHEYHPIEGAGHGFGSIDLFNREVTPGVTLFDRVLIWSREVLMSSPMFVDSFESGDTSAWSSTSPLAVARHASVEKRVTASRNGSPPGAIGIYTLTR